MVYNILDMSGIGDSMKKYSYNVDFFKTWSNDMAYILGFIMADGSISKRKSLEIENQYVDIEVLEFIKDKLGSNLELKVINKKHSQSKIQQKIVRLSIYNKNIVMDLEKLGVVNRKTGFEQIPENCPKEYIMDFIRGFFDGDGHISKSTTISKQVAIGSSSYKIVQQIRSFIGFGNIYKKGKQNFWYFMISNYKDIIKFKDLIYNGNFYLQRKFQRFNEMPPSKNYNI